MQHASTAKVSAPVYQGGEIAARPRFARRLGASFQQLPWLTPQRMVLYSAVMLFFFVAPAITVLLNPRLMDAAHWFVGGDFMCPYAASTAALHGNAASVYNLHRLAPLESAVTGDSGVMGGEGFYYPPTYLLLVLPLSLLPFVVSWLTFEAITLLGYLAVLRRIAPRRIAWWLAIAFPSVAMNFVYGQNAFLTTALLGGGLLLLESEPYVAGTLFGLMTFKPQLALLIPLALIAGRRWRAMAATAASTILFAAASTAVFGGSIWIAFLGSIHFAQKVVMESGTVGFSSLVSVFAAVRMWGGNVHLAYACQGMIAIYAALAVIWVWRSDRRFALKAAALGAGSVMVSPYVLQYDLVLLALPIAWVAMDGLEHGFMPYDKLVLLLTWFMPRYSYSLSKVAGIPIVPIATIALMTIILRRANRRPLAVRKDDGGPRARSIPAVAGA